MVSVTCPTLALRSTRATAEIDRPGFVKLREIIERLPLRPEHGMKDMESTIRIRQNMGDEQTPIDFVAFLGALLL